MATKILIASRDPFFQDYFWAALQGVPGIVAGFHEGVPKEAPDGHEGWVLLLESTEALEWFGGAGGLAGHFARGVVGVGVDCQLESPDPRLRLRELPLSPEELLAEVSLVGSDRPEEPSSVTRSVPVPRVLVAEDSPVQRQIVASMLRAEGFHVEEAEDGLMALEAARKRPPDILITDVEMPRMTGFELVRAIRAHPTLGRTPILILTTLHGFEQMKEGFDAGASDYLVKPQKGEREAFLASLLERILEQLQRERLVEGRRALVVDDSHLIRNLVSSAMTGAGFEVTVFENGRLARDYLEDPESTLPDVIVTDLEMPEVDGLHLTHFVKTSAHTRDIPVVILSGSTHRDHRILGRGFGADAFLSKPFAEEKLLVTVDQVLARKRLERERRDLANIIGRDVLQAVGKGELEARKVEMTVFFSDIAGFSTFCSHHEAPEVVKVLNDYFDVLAEQALRQQGTVNKFIGDAMVVLFSHRPGLAHHAVRAVTAAVEIQRAMRRVNQTAQHQILTRIGLNTGEVVMGLIGAGERKDFTVIGDHVNRAQRFEGKSPIGGILLSEQTFAAARGYLEEQDDLDLQQQTGIELKGIPHPVSAWRITVKES